MSTQKMHPEWEKENSLTSPDDRDIVNKWRPEQQVPPLEESQVTEAMNALSNISFVEKFPRVDRTYADPPPPLQNIGLISFTPAKGATPNSNGVYGFAKLRGNYSSQIEANQRAEYLIRHVDSYHQIYHTYVGRPFPITVSTKYSAETDEVDIRRETVEAVSADIKNKKKDDQKVIQEIHDREEELKRDTNRDIKDDPYELYVTLKVKKAQLSWNYLEHQKKMDEIKVILRKTKTELDELDLAHPKFQETYYDKYMHARTQAGIKETPEQARDNFMKYLVEDAVLPGVYTE